ncbi:MAG TPA: hypothetical protein VF275_00775 [Gammaproteobacteria bacterium]
MSYKILHQCGHYTNWNKESIQDDKSGDGLILSPVHYALHQVEKLPAELLTKSYFDPQFYLPRSSKKKLHSYDFFPETISGGGGFDTTSFSAVAMECAKRCVQFQVDKGFEGIVIPVRYHDQLWPDLTDRLDAFTVKPFLAAINSIGVDVPVFLTLVVTSSMLESQKYREYLLNWVTSYEEIDGIYLIPDIKRDLKQITSGTDIINFYRFCEEIKGADLELVLGYLNTEALLYSVLEPRGIATGAFENTRIFSVDKFLSLAEERRGPKARLYVPGLLNWIRLDSAKEISKQLPGLWKDIYVETEYGNQALDAMVEPTFNQPMLYKHYFIVFFRQLQELQELGKGEKIERLGEMVEKARVAYSKLDAKKIRLDAPGSDAHLQAWKEALEFMG